MSISKEELKQAFREVASAEFKNVPKQEDDISFSFSAPFLDRMEQVMDTHEEPHHRFFSVIAVAACLVVFAMGIFPIYFSGKAPGHTGDPGQSETEGNGPLSEVVFLEKWSYIHNTNIAIANFPKRPEDDADNYFAIDYLYSGTAPDIRFVGFDNPKAEEVLTEMLNITEESGSPVIRGCKRGGIRFNLDYSRMEPGEEIAINSITVSVDGAERTLDTTGRIILTRYTENEEAEMERADGITSYIESNGAYLTTVLQPPLNGYMSFHAESEVTVERIEIEDWVAVTGVEIYVGEEFESNKQEGFPVTVPAGKELNIYVTAMPTAQEEWDPFAIYRTNLRLHYRMADGEERVFLSRMLVDSFDGYGYQDRWAMEVDSILGAPEDLDEQILFLDDYMCWDLVAGNKPQIEIYFLYRDYLPYLKPESVDGRSVALEDVRVERIREYEYEGYRVGSLRFCLDYSDVSPGTKISINRIDLSVKGGKKTLDTTGSYSFRLAADGEYRWLRGNSVGAETKGVWMAGMAAPEKLTIREIEVSGPVKLENAVVKVGDKERGTLQEAFPLTLETGQGFGIVADVSYGTLSPYTDVSFNIFLHVTDENGTEQVWVEAERLCPPGFCVNLESPEFKKRYHELVDQVLKKK